MRKVDLYFSIDDSGKVDDKHDYSVYAGLLFLDVNKRSNFISLYSSIIENIRCKYCELSPETCHNDCPEVKSFIIKDKHKRRLLNIIKKEYGFVAIVDKKRITQLNTKDKKSKRRFLDYSVKMVVKSVIKELIKLKIISPNDDITLHINIDNEDVSTNGIYDLQNSIKIELSKGITKNGYVFQKIITGRLNVKVNYRDSSQHYDVQSADILAGTIRRLLVHSESFIDALNDINKYVNVIEIIPRQRK